VQRAHTRLQQQYCDVITDGLAHERALESALQSSRKEHRKCRSDLGGDLVLCRGQIAVLEHETDVATRKNGELSSSLDQAVVASTSELCASVIDAMVTRIESNAAEAAVGTDLDRVRDKAEDLEARQRDMQHAVKTLKQNLMIERSNSRKKTDMKKRVGQLLKTVDALRLSLKDERAKCQEVERHLSDEKQARAKVEAASVEREAQLGELSDTYRATTYKLSECEVEAEQARELCRAAQADQVELVMKRDDVRELKRALEATYRTQSSLAGGQLAEHEERRMAEYVSRQVQVGWGQ
jgi:chromosome segregation ATPase